MPPSHCTEPIDDPERDLGVDTAKTLDVVCFGLLFRMYVATVEKYPEADSGTPILRLAKWVGADACC